MPSFLLKSENGETDEEPLLNRDVRVNLKTVIGGAAVASFVLGALAAAVVSGAPARTNSAALYAQPREGHAWLPYLHGRADGASDGRAPEPVRQAVHVGQGLQREGRLLREHVPCQRHPLRRPLCQAGLGV